MFKPFAIKEITNPRQEQVVRVGGDEIFTQGRTGAPVSVGFNGNSLAVSYVRYQRGRGTKVFIKREYYINNIGGEITTDPRLSYSNSFGWAILRSGTSIDIRYTGDNTPIIQYPE